MHPAWENDTEKGSEAAADAAPQPPVAGGAAAPVARPRDDRTDCWRDDDRAEDDDDNDGSDGAALHVSARLGVHLAQISPLELLNSCSGDAADDLLPPDLPTVVINSEGCPPTAKQKRIARVVMGVAFVLLATCVILVGVTLSMSDHIDELVRQSQFHGTFMRRQQQLLQQQQQQQQQPAVPGNAGTRDDVTLKSKSTTA